MQSRAGVKRSDRRTVQVESHDLMPQFEDAQERATRIEVE